MCFSTTLQNLNVHILSFSITAVTHTLFLNLNIFLAKPINILWATVVPFSLRLQWQTMVLAEIILSQEDNKALTGRPNVSLLKGWISVSHAPKSLDLKPLNYNVWLEMWQRVHQTKFHNIKTLNHMPDMMHCVMQSVIDDAFGHKLRVINDVQLMSVVNIPPCACICVTGRHFWHLVFFPYHPPGVLLFVYFVKIRSKPALLC